MGLGIVWFGSSKNWIGQNIQTYLGGALVGGLILFGLSRWFPQVANFVPKPKPGKCRVCSRLARDVLIVDGGKKAGVFCRRHVIEKFQQAFGPQRKGRSVHDPRRRSNRGGIWLERRAGLRARPGIGPPEMEVRVGRTTNLPSDRGG